MLGHPVILPYVNCLGATFLFSFASSPFLLVIKDPFWMSYFVHFDFVCIRVPKDSDFNIYRTGTSQYPSLGIC